MDTNSSSAGLVIGLAAVGLALVAGVWLNRRNQARTVPAAPEDEVDRAAVSGGEEPIMGEDLAGNQATDREVPRPAAQAKLPLDYFLLVFILAAPFYLFGGGKLPLPINLPVGALATFVPATAAAILSYRQSGSKGVKEFLKKAIDYKKIKHKTWYLPVLFLMPLISVISYAVMRITGLPLPDQVQIPLLAVLVFFAMFLIGDAGEELGWMGYAIDPLQNRWGAFKGGLILGIVWVIWHTIPWVQTGNPPIWIFWQGLFSVAFRILSVWIYNNTGKSVFAATLFHTTSNMGWAFFPNFGTHYNPMVTSLITLLAAGFLLLGWEPKTLRRSKLVSGENYSTR